MKIKKQIRVLKGGFTLIEIIIYISISSIMLVGIFAMYFNVEQNITFLQNLSRKERTADLIFRSFTSDVFVCRKDGAFIENSKGTLVGIGEQWRSVHDCILGEKQEEESGAPYLELTFYIDKSRYSNIYK